MKRIIQGKIYNTLTAELIVRGNNGLSGGDCYYKTEELYRTPRGNYFICTYDNSLVVVKGNKLCRDSEYYEITTIFEWIENWNVAELPDREVSYFCIEIG